jgi:hypothetical protein
MRTLWNTADQKLGVPEAKSSSSITHYAHHSSPKSTRSPLQPHIISRFFMSRSSENRYNKESARANENRDEEMASRYNDDGDKFTSDDTDRVDLISPERATSKLGNAAKAKGKGRQTSKAKGKHRTIKSI